VIDIASDYAEERKDRELSFDVYSSPAEILDAVRGGAVYDIFVLDIIMPEMNGIQLGTALRDICADVKIIYLTSSRDYALDSFRVHPVDYIIKPVEKATFYKAMDDAIASISVKRDKNKIIKTKDGSSRVMFDSILYAELSRRTLRYRLVGGKTLESTTLRTTFAEATADLMSDARFAACGASTIVNLHRVTDVEAECAVLEGGERLFFNKKLCRELRAAWNNYWISQGGGI
jgi:DNA-binding LytR/AlgR family response regulator